MFTTPQNTYRASAPRPDMVAIKTAGPGDISYEDILLKQNAAIYESGQLLVLEYTQSDPDGDPGAEPPVDPSGFDTRGTKYIPLVGSDWEEFPELEVAVNLYRTNAAAGDVPVTVVTRLAEIKSHETDLSELSEPEQAAVLAAAAKTFVIFR